MRGTLSRPARTTIATPLSGIKVVAGVLWPFPFLLKHRTTLEHARGSDFSLFRF